MKTDEAYLIKTRRHIHANPELSLNEHKTAAFIEEQLDSFIVEHRRMGETGVLGIIRGGRGTGKTVLLRADTDALPITEETGADYASQNAGVMHACGHDAHTAALLGAAKALQEKKDEFRGLVLLVFQPAEEFGSGSRYFKELFGTADRAFAVHVSPNLPVLRIGLNYGAFAAACDFFRITVKGKGAHITRPQDGIDALYIAERLYAELKSLTSRLLDPFENALIGIGKLIAGSTYNIIADKAVLEGSVRSFSESAHNTLKAAIRSAAEQVSAMYGGGVDVEFETFAPACINDGDAVNEVIGIAEGIVGSGNIVIHKTPAFGFGADDFGEFLKETKGVYVQIGTANDVHPNTKQPLHNSRFDIDERALTIAANLYASYALSVLSKQENDL